MAFSSKLSIDDLVTVQTKVWTARQKWYNIGLQLGLKVDVLDCIKVSSNNTDSDSCFTAMLKAWLREENIEKTWGKLIMALKSETVGFSALAESITESHDPLPIVRPRHLNERDSSEAPNSSCSQSSNEYRAEGAQCDATLVLQKPERAGFICPCGHCSIEQFFETGCPQSSNPTLKTYPYLDTEHLTDHERCELYFRLNEETRSILSEFSDLINHTIKSFKENNVDPQDIKTTLLTYAPQLIHSEILKCANKINEIINALIENGYLSFFNYHIAEHLIKQHGTRTDDGSMNDKWNTSCNPTMVTDRVLSIYETKFNQFCKRSVFEINPDVFARYPCDGEILAFKVTSVPTKSIHSKNATSVEDSCKADSYRSLSNTSEISSKTLNLSLEDTIIIQGRIANSLGLENKWSLVFLGASKGCVQLNFSMSMPLYGKLKSQLNITEANELNPETGIINLEASGIHILCGPPGTPYASEITDDSFTLKWARPEYYGLHPPDYYCISYRSTTDHPNKWRMENTQGLNEHLVIRNLPQKESTFISKVKAVNKIGAGIESRESSLITLSSTSAAKLSTECQHINTENKKKDSVQDVTADPNGEEAVASGGKYMYENAVIDSDMKRHMEVWKKVAQERPLRVMVCGQAGVGKTSLIYQLFQLESDDLEMWRRHPSDFMKIKWTTKRGIKVCLFEISRFNDVDMSNEMMIKIMEEIKEKPDIVFYCIRIAFPAQMQLTDVRAIKRMTHAFSNEIWKKAVVIFTFADVLKERKNSGEYWMVIRHFKEKIKEVLRKEYVPEDIIKELPMLTAGYTEPLLQYEAGYTEPLLQYEAKECISMDGWDTPLFLAALKQIDPVLLPALFEVRWSWKNLGAALGRGVEAATGAGTGALAGAVVGEVLGPVSVATGAGVGALIGAAIGGGSHLSGASLGIQAYQLVKIKSILRIKYMKWQLNRTPVSPHQATLKD